MEQLAIDAVYMRGGTSRALIFRESDLPSPQQERDAIFLAATGSPDPNGRQLDGMGGGLSSLSKIAIVGPSARPDADVDYLWSYDCFVHIGPEDTAGYLRDIHRVLKPGGEAVIHHAGRNHRMLAVDGMRQFGPLALSLYNRFSVGEWTTTDGWRSAMSKERFAQLARQAGLEVVRQQQDFGPGNAFAVRRFGDWITTMRRPC